MYNNNQKFLEQKINESNEIINTIKKEIHDKKEFLNFTKIFNTTIIGIGLFILPLSMILVRIYWHNITFYAIFYMYLLGVIPLSLISLITGAKTKKKLNKLKKELSINNKNKENYINELNTINSVSNISNNDKVNYKQSQVKQEYSYQKETQLIKKRTLK